MLNVKTPDEVFTIIRERFLPLERTETVPPEKACGRTGAREIVSIACVPDFDRSTVDGYALRSRDTFGCSDALPAMLRCVGAIEMGKQPTVSVKADTCAAIPTGGALPDGADAVVMLEYAEDFGDGTVGIGRPAAPGMNVIYRGDDLCAGQKLFEKGHVFSVRDIGVLAAAGVASVQVAARPSVGVVSTGDELVPVDSVPAFSEVRDVNGAMLTALSEELGCTATYYGIVRDDAAALRTVLERATAENDIVLLSGGSSVGEKDAAYRVLHDLGTVLFHGIAMKPGKPTLLAEVSDKPVLGLPGHPGAAYFVAKLLLPHVLRALTGRTSEAFTVPARLTAPVSANHGRAQFTAVKLFMRDGTLFAAPIHAKSGLIRALSDSDGYFEIPPEAEGVAAGETVPVTRYD